MTEIHASSFFHRSILDNGPEFIAFELPEWLEAEGSATYHIEPGKFWQNSFADSFNARFRDEWLNMHEFWSIEHARVVLENWRNEFNTEHLHSSLGYMTPAQFASSCGVA
jgi:transposase InsO family protein